MPNVQANLTLILTLFSLFLMSCGIGVESNYVESLSLRQSPTYNKGPAEINYCSTNFTPPSPVTISGSATFTERALSGMGLGAESAPKNIRHAEIIVTNASGSIIQCSSVDATGNFSFTVPTGTSPLTIKINSRANNSFVNASVLNMPEQNLLYSIASNFIPDSTKNIGTLNASARASNYIGAAFHILDLIVTANEFLTSEVGSCSSAIDNCVDFIVTDKVNIYWEPGFNPNSYFGEPNSGLSFYLPGLKRLFILGGINGDVDSSDTDHFDDTIIIHEYGHFLEDVYSMSDSPGGAHSGKFAIDPRLAFSEAWGNFLQAAVNYGASSTDPRYADTAGNVDGDSTVFLLNVPLETKSSSCIIFPPPPLEPPNGCTNPLGCFLNIPGCDLPTEPGEGNYREFAITRTLWDVFDTNNDSETVSGRFNEVWASMTSGNGYVSGTDSKFRSAGLLYEIQSSLSLGATSPISDWSTAQNMTDNSQEASRAEYAQKLVATGSCSVRNFSILPYNDFGDNQEYITSNLFKNNDFYHYQQASSGPATITLNYMTSSGVEADLDLIIYNETANYGNPIDMLRTSRNFKSSPDGDVETEEVSFLNLPAGDYLINVKVKSHHTTNVGANTDYELLLGGTRLCP